ncbi:HlyD family efflux transporter periplasmic adaptor subunit [Bosea caraganae]|uniref:HlyD family efflux transporter periplasmic adaptor subunit n=1 Tax=Bosea caraganae TaxID=2763117 RepID=A0A370L7C7_9HYPH|nr:HlyD family efflux transporter periplasmic adaptor subunit [Bosea caraganae]RDJ24952.1 HlyD family efflux transporter periplasmic adaptor subunit [Bosea caraganae]RDJ26063.1 HlyD family efflux transporter periplasmic adaptor subunit [Bosea caraganae]
MSKPIRILLLLILLGAAGGGAWWYLHRPKTSDELTLYGNVDLRQASLAFNGNERIAAVLVEEGDIVRAGQVLARLDTSRLKPQVAQAEASLASQKAALLKLRNGSRPEEIEQARSNLNSARADSVNASAQYDRRRALSANAVSQQDLDAAKAAAEVATAKVAVAKSSLDLALVGPRIEDIKQAEAQVLASEAQLALIRQQLADAELMAPFDAIVRSRLMEPGEMASPMRPVFSLAERSTKWVRSYVPEPKLGHIRSGERTKVISDSFPDKPLDGWIGFISPVAEFTPKTVQTEDLRTSLVYEVRVFVEDPNDVLRLGMPATVRLLPDAEPKALPPGQTGKPQP